MCSDTGDYSSSGGEVSGNTEGGYDAGDADTKVSDADTKVSDADTKVSDADTKVSDADTKVSDADTKVSDADTKVSDADTKVSDADTKVSDADTKVSDADTKEGLTEEEKNELKEETGWSDEVTDAIRSKEEADIYKEAGLREEVVDGRVCLVSDNIDMEQKDEFGDTNRQRISDNLSPINKNGETVELHHIGQKADSPLAELTTAQHRQNGNDKILHDKNKTSEIDRSAFAKEKQQHWRSRVGQ